MKTPQTPIPKLSEALHLTNEVWFKREDKHKYGSQKGRSIPLLVREVFEAGKTTMVISSSGNAALAAARTVQSHNRNNGGQKISLTVFVGQSIAPKKLELLHKEITDENILLKQVENPKQQAVQAEAGGEAINLRQSTNDSALIGYEELAIELSKIENLAAVFVPTSSGTTAQGLYNGFQKIGINPQIHIVQTTSCHPMVDALTDAQGTATPPNLPLERGGSQPPPLPEGGLTGGWEQSIATAIVDKVAHRKDKVVEAIKNSHGAGWIATNDDITKAMDLTKQTSDLSISPNAALSVVGLMLAVQNKCTWTGPVVCLITGL